MAKIKQLQENSQDIFPVTHEDAVLDSNGVSIINKLNEHISNHPGGGTQSDVNKAYVDSQDKLLDDKIDILSVKVDNHLANHPSGDGGSNELIPRITKEPVENEIFLLSLEKSEFGMVATTPDKVEIVNNTFKTIGNSARVLITVTKAGLLTIEPYSKGVGYYYYRVTKDGVTESTSWLNDLKKANFDLKEGDSVSVEFDSSSIGWEFRISSDSKEELSFNSKLGIVPLSSAGAGQPGKDGVDGKDGVTPNIQIGTVSTLEPGQNATVTRKGTNENPIFDFGIPKGSQGEPGKDGVGGEGGGSSQPRLIVDYVYNENKVVDILSLDATTGIFTTETPLGFTGRKTVTFKPKNMDSAEIIRSIPYEIKDCSQGYSVEALSSNTFKVRDNNGEINSYDLNKVVNLDLKAFTVEYDNQQLLIENLNCANALIEVVGIRNRAGWTNVQIKTTNKIINGDSVFPGLDGRQWGLATMRFEVYNYNYDGTSVCRIISDSKMCTLHSSREYYDMNGRYPGTIERVSEHQTPNLLETFVVPNMFANGTRIRIYDLGGE